MPENSVIRFVEMYDQYYEQAVKELHSSSDSLFLLMYFIFPQLARGYYCEEPLYRDIAKYYAIQDLDEAETFLASPCGEKMQNLLKILLEQESNDPQTIFGNKAVKFQASMTLFSAAAPENQLFKHILDKFFNGQMDEKTLKILEKQRREKLSGIKEINESEYLIYRLEEFWKILQELKRGTSKVRHNSPLFPIMNVLPHLHFPEGTVLDCYMQSDPLGLGSELVLYVRKGDEPRLPDRYSSISDSAEKNPDIFKTVTPEFSPKGVWELILLAELGTQFNLVWHANYNLRRIICNMEEFFSGWYCGCYDDCCFKVDQLSEQEKSKLLSWDIEPKVKMLQDRALAKYCIFSPFSGFFKVEREISFKPELQLSKPRIMRVNFYDCGIKF